MIERSRACAALRLAAPALVFLAGVAGQALIRPQRVQPLERPLREFPAALDGFEAARELEVPEANRRRLRADDLLYRSYTTPDGRELTLYVAYYGSQTNRTSIHSPSNCLPGSGWEPVERGTRSVATIYGPTEVNRYVVEHGSGARALVYYWYQGRGRVAADEYGVKLELVRDAIFERRTDEGLVRLVFPLGRSRDHAPEIDRLADAAVGEVVSALDAHLPG